MLSVDQGLCGGYSEHHHLWAIKFRDLSKHLYRTPSKRHRSEDIQEFTPARQPQSNERLGIQILEKQTCLSLSLLVVLCGCPSDPPDPTTTAFLSKTLTEQRAAILGYPLAQQVDLYVEALRRKHPRDLGLGVVLAKQGAPLVPVLTDRLKEHPTDWEIDKVQLISVLTHMQYYGTYDVAGDRQLMVLLDQKVADMEMPFWKDLAQNYLKPIRSYAGDANSLTSQKESIFRFPPRHSFTTSAIMAP